VPLCFFRELSTFNLAGLTGFFRPGLISLWSKANSTRFLVIARWRLARILTAFNGAWMKSEAPTMEAKIANLRSFGFVIATTGSRGNSDLMLLRSSGPLICPIRKAQNTAL